MGTRLRHTGSVKTNHAGIIQFFDKILDQHTPFQDNSIFNDFQKALDKKDPRKLLINNLLKVFKSYLWGWKQYVLHGGAPSLIYE